MRACYCRKLADTQACRRRSRSLWGYYLRISAALTSGVLGCSLAAAQGASNSTASLAIGGVESGSSGNWASGYITVSFGGYSEQVAYGQFSTAASMAAALAAMFTRDYSYQGLYAKAGAHNNSDLNVVTFQLTNGTSFTPLSIQNSSGFTFSASGFGSGGSTYDTGTVTLQAGTSAGQMTKVARTAYSNGATPASIASALAASASSKLVSVTAHGNTLSVTAKQSGASTDYPYQLIFTYDSQDFSSPSFSAANNQGSLAGGTDPSSGGSSTPVFQLSVSDLFGNSGYDADGNIVAMSDNVMGQWSYGYDGLNRLTSGWASSGPFSSENVCWSYDNFGNRLGEAVSQASCSSSPAPSSWALYTLDGTPNTADNGLNRISATNTGKFTYDGDGNVTSDGINTYRYNGENQLCAVATPLGMMGYQYDAEGRRIGKGSITQLSCDLTTNGYRTLADYVLGQNGEQVTELVSNGNGTMAWEHTNAFLNGGPLATYDAYGIHLYTTDLVGSRRIQTNAAGAFEQSCQGLPFGSQLTCTGSLDTPTEQQFTGKERDTESGKDYFGARFYGSSMGRFISPDPSQLMFASATNPQTLNLYSYALNNPLRNTDPTGLYCYYGDTNGGAQEDADQQDPVEWDYESSQSECGQNGGSWTTDAETHIDESGDIVDNENRSHIYTMNTGQTAGELTAGGAMDIGYELGQTLVAGLLDIPIGLLNSLSNPSASINIPYFRLFLTHYCGPGGGGNVYSDTGRACQQHDISYGKTGIDFTANIQLLGKTMTPQQVQAAQAANQALYDAASAPLASGSGQTSLQYWLTGQVKVPFGGGYTIYPGTEARPH